MYKSNLLKQNKAYKLYEHQLPKIIRRFPILIFYVHLLHQILHNRNRILLRKLMRVIKKMGGEIRMLDAGCGEGNNCIPLAHRFKTSTIYDLGYTT